MHRGRPYRKNDQCHVEQKNWTHVRQLFGYIRIDDKAKITMMNEIYGGWNDYQNHFILQVKLIRKTRIGARYRREYSPPITPYDRVMACADVSPEAKEKLREVNAGLNPFELRSTLDRLLRAFLRKHISRKAMESAA